MAAGRERSQTPRFLGCSSGGADTHPTVLRRMAEGLSYRQIAERLVLSHRTAQNHVQNTLGKLQLHNRVELVRYTPSRRGLDD